MDKVTYAGFENCCRIANNEWQAIVTTEVGPRILFYGRIDGPNHLGEFLEAGETTDFGRWKPYGGHRLWVAPESKPFSYAPDNEPIETRNEGDLCLRVVQKTDAAEVDKEMTISLDPLTSRLKIGHKITNRAVATREMAIWALTIFKGGQAIVPLDRYRSHDDALLPSQAMILWPFTNLADPRIKLGDGWLRFHAEPLSKEPQKLGLACRRQWAAHFQHDEVFVKRFNYVEGATYPDMGSSCEIYVAADFMEVETLSPLSRLQPGQSIEHTESWELHSIAGTELEAFLANQNLLP